MNRKILHTFAIFALLFLVPFEAAARGLGAPQPQGAGSTTSVSFADLGYVDSELVGPFDATRKIFSVPANWRLLPGGFVELNFDVIFTGGDIGVLDAADASYAGVLTVSFNNQVIGTIRLNKAGSFTERLQIPAAAIQSVREDGQHELKVQLTAQFDCLYDIRTVVLVKALSKFDLPFEISSPELNLARLPAPFYLRNSLLPDRTVLVVPDAPAAQELQAVLNVETGFGSMVGRTFDFELVTSSLLTEELLASSHLIFVGTPDDFPLLPNVAFPTPVSNGQFTNLPAEAAEDGVVELALSPWNTNKVVMLVSGNSPEAVLKAGMAVGDGKIFVYQNPTVVYVSDVQKELAGALPLVEDFSLQDLGYENETLRAIGVDQVEYSFYVAKEQIATKDGQITLAYYHSGLLEYSLSSLSVDLNGQVIASQPFTEESEQITYLPIKIPPGLLRFGENRLVVSAKMQPDLSCDFSGFSEPWLTVSNQTAIHLPATEIDAGLQDSLVDLKYYPGILMTRSDLGDLAFVLSENDLAGWKVAAQLAYNLGEEANPSIPNLVAVYAGDVPQDVRDNYSLIMIGKPDALPLLGEINNSLPAPFDFESNTANERQMQIVYRLPEGVYVGYLELLASPYNPGMVVLVVSGNADEGVTMAGQALVTDQLKDKLAGLFAVTNGTQVAVSNSPSHFSVVGTLIPPANQVVTTPLPGGQTAPNFEQPFWLLPLMIVSALVVLLVIVFVVIRSFARNRSPQMGTPEEKPAEKPNE